MKMGCLFCYSGNEFLFKVWSYQSIGALSLCFCLSEFPLRFGGGVAPHVHLLWDQRLATIGCHLVHAGILRCSRRFTTHTSCETVVDSWVLACSHAISLDGPWLGFSARWSTLVCHRGASYARLLSAPSRRIVGRWGGWSHTPSALRPILVRGNRPSQPNIKLMRGADWFRTAGSLFLWSCPTSNRFAVRGHSLVRPSLLGEHAAPCLESVNSTVAWGVCVRDAWLLNSTHGTITELAHLLWTFWLYLEGRACGSLSIANDSLLHKATGTCTRALHALGHELVLGGRDWHAWALLGCNSCLITAAALKGRRLVPVELICLAADIQILSCSCCWCIYGLEELICSYLAHWGIFSLFGTDLWLCIVL